jgi:hypothetical protein
MATLAGHAAVVNQQQTINSLSATVHSDPSSLDFSLAALKSSTEGMISSSPNLTGPQAACGALGDPAEGCRGDREVGGDRLHRKDREVPPWATDPKYSPYINGAELKTFENAAKAQAKVNAYYEKQTAITQQKLNERQAESRQTMP